MIKDELKKLGEYTDELEKEKPLDLLNNYISKITEELDSLSDYQLNLGKEFKDNIIKVVNDYTVKDLSTQMVSYQLLCVLISFIKKSKVEDKAISLGVNRNLYKKEMKFLFKGTWR